MVHRPLVRRASLPPRALPALVLAATLATGCRSGGGFTLNAVSEGVTPRTLLGCVAEVATESGFPLIEQRPDAREPTLRARSAPVVGSGTRAPEARRMDVLTVSLARVGSGLRVLAQTFDPRPGSAAPVAAMRAPQSLARFAANTGPTATETPADEADGTLWEATAPSRRVADARDAVLERCGSLR